LRRLIEVGRSLVSELDLETLLRHLLDDARALTGARYAALGILDERRESLERFITVGIDEAARAAIGDLPRGRGILGELIRAPQPLRLADVAYHPRSYGFPAAHPPMHSFLGVPILIRGQAYGNLYLTEKAEGDFDEADEQAVVTLADWAAIAIDNARLYARVNERRDELERAVRALEATTTIARAVGGEVDLERILELIAKRGRAQADARWLAVMLLEGDELVVSAAAGDLERDIAGVRVPVQGSVPGRIVLSGRAERIVGASAPDRPDPKLPDLGVSLSAALVTPMSFRARPAGVLVAADRMPDHRAFSEEDEELVAGFAASAATALATAKLVEQERLHRSIQAAERERHRWARELHDETLQGLGGLRVLLSSGLRRSNDDMRSAVEQAVEQLGAEIDGLRALITELRPAALTELGLRAALRSLLDRVSAVEGLEIDGEIDLGSSAGRVPTRLAPDLESTLYRLVQESLTNVAKHARANRVEVRVAERGEAVEASIRDDGSGFDPGSVQTGPGLVGMRERVELAGGRLTVESQPGEGTCIEAVLPLRRRQAGQAESEVPVPPVSS
jgi:signal transduction histidine kinase